MFSTQSSFRPSRNCASPPSTPRKNSSYSTYEEEESFEKNCHELCEDFSEHGACMNGAGCELLHHRKDSSFKKPCIKSSVMGNFP